MMMVMMVVMVTFAFVQGHMAVTRRTFFTLGLQLQCGMTDAVMAQFVPNSCLDLVGVTVGDDVHGGAVVPLIHAPKVDMVHIQHPGNFRKMFLNGLHIHIPWSFLQKIGKGLV